MIFSCLSLLELFSTKHEARPPNRQCACSKNSNRLIRIIRKKEAGGRSPHTKSDGLAASADGGTAKSTRIENIARDAVTRIVAASRRGRVAPSNRRSH